MRVHARLFALVILALPALFAAAPGEPLSVEWTAHEGCPDVNDYWKGVALRSSRIRRASTGEPAARARVVIRRSGDRSVATFTLGGAPREIAAATCSEVVDALALMTVLALDPKALTASSTLVASSASVAPSASVASSPLEWVDSSASVATRPSGSAAPSAPHALPVRPALPTAASPPAHTRFAAALGGQLLAIGAGVAYGPVVAVAVEHDRTAVRFALGHAMSELIRNERGPAARFAFDTARLEVCPWTWGETVRVAPCAGASAGIVRASPTDAANLREEWRPWSAFHVHGRAEWLLSRMFGVELELGAALPLWREEFVIEPDYFLFRLPAVLVSSQLSLAVHFP